MGPELLIILNVLATKLILNLNTVFVAHIFNILFSAGYQGPDTVSGRPGQDGKEAAGGAGERNAHQSGKVEVKNTSCCCSSHVDHGKLVAHGIGHGKGCEVRSNNLRWNAVCGNSATS